LRQLAREFPTDEYINMVSIELVNEPANWSLDLNIVRKFYDDGIGTMRKLMAGE
jgi:hypothetical protein